jgi:hypothetical protein
MTYVGAVPTTGDFKKLDSITTSSTTTFNLRQGGVAVYPQSANHCIVSLNGVIQAPVDAFTIVNDTIVFASSLASSDVINFILVLGNVNDIGVPSSGSVGISQLSASGTKDATTFLRGDNTFAAAGTTINNNADNRVITGSGTANTLEGEADLTFDGTDLDVGASAKISSNGAIANFSNHNGSATETALASSDGNEKVRCFNSGLITFETGGSERMRITSDGDIRSYGWVGNGSGQGWKLNRDSNQGQFILETHLTTTRDMQQFVNGNGTVGGIQTTGSTVNYVSGSDYRLKENETPIVDGIERLKQLKPYRFNFKADADTTVDGFFAHEVSSVVPEAITGDKDAMAVETRYTSDDEETQGDNPSKNIGDPKTYSSTEIKPQGIDQAKLVPLLTKALQEAITKIETLETRVKTLEDA